jgi:hypothetical protein
MSTTRLDPTTWQHIFALRGNETVPRGNINSAMVVNDALATARGLRALGLGAPCPPATSILTSWIFNHTRGSVLLAALFHATTDVAIA